MVTNPVHFYLYFRQDTFSHSDDTKNEENQNEDTEISSRPSPGCFETCPGVSVEFHVLIHDEWKFDPLRGDKSVHIHFGVDCLGYWKCDYVKMEPAKLDEYSLLRDSFD